MTDAELLTKAISFDAGTEPIINGYIVDTEDEIHRISVTYRGKGRWAVCRGGSCLSKSENAFVYEPRPSARTDDFLNDVRFDSPREAFAFYEVWKEKTLAEAKAAGMITWSEELRRRGLEK